MDSQKGYVFEINAGIGRNLLSKQPSEVVGRWHNTKVTRFYKKKKASQLKAFFYRINSLLLHFH
jgi:hypothetical protein